MYDLFRVILRGKSEKLCYLWIHNDKVEIRDAEHLRGLGSLDAAERIRKEGYAMLRKGQPELREIVAREVDDIYVDD